MKQQLEIGDKIKRFEVIREIEFVYEITSVTKTLAKTDDGIVFIRDINYAVTKPLPHYMGEVKRKGNCVDSTRYFLIN